MDEFKQMCYEDWSMENIVDTHTELNDETQEFLECQALYEDGMWC